MYLLNRCTYWILLDVLHNLRLLSTKFRVFHNAVLFGHKQFMFYIKFAVKFKYFTPRPEGWERKWKTHGILHPIFLYAFTLQSFRYEACLTVFATTMHIRYFTQESERRLYHHSSAYSEFQSGQTGRLQQNCFKRKDRRLVRAKLFHRDGQMITDRIFITPKTTDAYAQLKVRTWNGRMCILSCKDIHSAVFECRKDSLTDTWYSLSPPCKERIKRHSCI